VSPALLIADAPPDPPRHAPQPVSAWDVHPRVLVVDPAGAIGAVVARWLGAHGYEVVTVGSLHAALDACRAQPPHLLVSYRSIRGGTPQQLYREVRRDPQLRRIAALYITSLDDGRELQAALLAGAQAYHTIPFDIDLLYEQIRALLAKTEGWLLPPSAADLRLSPES
jgi:CheY-like chemotaxis protein